MLVRNNDDGYKCIQLATFHLVPVHVDDAYPAASSLASEPASTNTSSRQLSIAASARGRNGDRNSVALTRASSDAGSARDKDAVEKASEPERNGDGCEAG